METPRVQLWFAEIDNSNPERLVYARRASGACSLLPVVETAGSLPTFPLGSFWHDRTIQHGLIMDDQIKVENALIPPQRWVLVRPDEYISISDVYGIHEFPLRGEDISGQFHNLKDAPYYRCYTDTGSELIIPAYEVFRRFYGVCSTLSNALLANHWSKELDKLIVYSETGMTPEGDAYKILPKQDISPIACRANAHFEVSDYACMQAHGFFVNIENARRRGIIHPWIQAHPHWVEEEKDSMTLSFIGQQLSSGAILVLWIYNSEFPELPVPLIRIHAEQKIPKNAKQPASEKIGFNEDINEDHFVINPPADTRPGKFISHLAISETWSNLPNIENEYKKIIFIEAPTKNNENSIRRKRDYGTGHKSRAGRLASASLSANEQNIIKDRFSALATCFQNLIEKKAIKGRLDYGLSNPVSIENTVYCTLPTHLGNTPIPWAIVGRGEQARGRLCWVSEIMLPDNSVQYFFELEVLNGEAFYALIVKPIGINAHLSEETLFNILKIAVSTKGRWNICDLTKPNNEILWGKIKHKMEKGAISADYVRRKLL